MLSILIPTYNYDVLALVESIYKQAIEIKINFEILVIDDGSSSKINTKNNQVNALPNCKFYSLKRNIGRSAIRNLLANEAKFENLLFLDADVLMLKPDFLKCYVTNVNARTEIIYGGLKYQKKTPQKHKMLRWVYGKKRETLDVNQRIKKPHISFLSINFLIKKTVFNTIKFNEVMPNLRSEDLVFALDARSAGITIKHIHNPVIHMGIENSAVYLEKTNATLLSFKIIIALGILNPNDVLITRVATTIIAFKLTFIFKIIWCVFKNIFIKNILSKKPSLFIFDLYRLCYFLHIKNTN